MRETINGAYFSYEEGYRANFCILYNDYEDKIIEKCHDQVMRGKNKSLDHCVMIIAK